MRQLKTSQGACKQRMVEKVYQINAKSVYNSNVLGLFLTKSEERYMRMDTNHIAHLSALFSTLQRAQDQIVLSRIAISVDTWNNQVNSTGMQLPVFCVT